MGSEGSIIRRHAAHADAAWFEAHAVARDGPVLSPTGAITTFDTTLPLETFLQILGRVRQQHGTAERVSTGIRRYMHADMVMEQGADGRSRVYRNVCLEAPSAASDGWIHAAYRREFLSPLRFPSTRDVPYIEHIKRSCFRLSPFLTIHFEVCGDNHGRVFRRVYVSYRHARGVDVDAAAEGYLAACTTAQPVVKGASAPARGAGLRT